MSNSINNMHSNNKTERLNVTLTKSTVELIDHIWPSRQFRSRSAFLDEAARRYAHELQKRRIKTNLKIGYLAQAKRDFNLNKEWEVANLEN